MRSALSPAFACEAADPPVDWAAQWIEPSIIPVNNTKVWKDGSFTGGIEGITDAGADDSYIKFNVAPGTWEFEAK